MCEVRKLKPPCCLARLATYVHMSPRSPSPLRPQSAGGPNPADAKHAATAARNTGHILAKMGAW